MAKQAEKGLLVVIKTIKAEIEARIGSVNGIFFLETIYLSLTS
ncbi:MAG TPA: hypothetical protein PKU76_03630 [Candidatus Cloacimonas sp.]|nr:hypothetical protein [Candidatus Cloacimonas sp.]